MPLVAGHCSAADFAVEWLLHPGQRRRQHERRSGQKQFVFHGKPPPVGSGMKYTEETYLVNRKYEIEQLEGQLEN